jgi:hypothetical protein
MRIGRKFAVLALIGGAAFFLASSAFAQSNGFSTTNFGGATIHGNPPSVTSFGFGGTPGPHGVPASVTSLNFGSAPFHASTRFSGFVAGPPRLHRRNHHRFVSPAFFGGYYVPYAYDYADYEDPGYYILSPGPDDTMEHDYRGGPTIFDRRGSGQYARSRPSHDDYRDELDSAQPEPAAAPAQPVADQPDTVLIFRDGRKLEVQNYAIVGATLYDLSDGKSRKVALAELDLPATVKQNDERGISFQLPAGTKQN